MGPRFPANTAQAPRLDAEWWRRDEERTLLAVSRRASGRSSNADSFAYRIPVPHRMTDDSTRMLLDRVIPALNDKLEAAVRGPFCSTHWANIAPPLVAVKEQAM